MKAILLIISLTSTLAYGQTNAPSLRVTSSLQNMNYLQLRNAVELAEQRQRIEALKAELARAKANGVVVKSLVEQLQGQNEELRKQMKSYMEEIDKMNEENFEKAKGGE